MIGPQPGETGPHAKVPSRSALTTRPPRCAAQRLDASGLARALAFTPLSRRSCAAWRGQMTTPGRILLRLPAFYASVVRMLAVAGSASRTKALDGAEPCCLSCALAHANTAWILTLGLAALRRRARTDTPDVLDPPTRPIRMVPALRLNGAQLSATPIPVSSVWRIWSLQCRAPRRSYQPVRGGRRPRARACLLPSLRKWVAAV